MDDNAPPAHLFAVLTKSELLEQVEAKAKSRADIARVLNLAPARITEMFKGDRDLSFDEARKLMVHYAVDDTAGSVDLTTFAAENGLALIEEVDLALGMGASFLDGRDPEVLATVPFRVDWLRGLFAGPLSSLKVVRGRGDSMQPTILDGDIVLVDTAHRSIDDQDRIWAIAYGELGMIRRVRVTPRGTLLLMPDNAVVRPDEVADGEAAIIGRVIWIGRRM